MSKILNTLLCALMAFFLCFLWIVYCLKEPKTAALLAAIVAICCGYLVFRAEKARDDRRSVKRRRTKQINDFKQTLRFGADNAALFEQMLTYYDFETRKLGCDDLVGQKNGKYDYFALRFAEEKVSDGEVVKATVSALRQNCDKLYLFGCKVDQAQLKSAAAHIDIEFVDAANAYELFERADKLPKITQKFHPISPILPNMFCRRKAGWYFATSLFTLAISVVSFFPWYTLAWATVSFALAMYSLLNKRYNVLPTAIKLD